MFSYESNTFIFKLWLLLVVILSALAIGGRLNKVYKEDLLGKVKVTIAWPFPDQESLPWGDGNIIHEHMDHLHLHQNMLRFVICVTVSWIEPLVSIIITNPCLVVSCSSIITKMNVFWAGLKACGVSLDIWEAVLNVWFYSGLMFTTLFVHCKYYLSLSDITFSVSPLCKSPLGTCCSSIYEVPQWSEPCWR